MGNLTDEDRKVIWRVADRFMVDALMGGPRFKGFNRGKRCGRTVEEDVQDFMALYSRLELKSGKGE